MLSDTHYDILKMVERWAIHELPHLNRSTEAHGDVRFLINSCQIRVEAIVHAARDVRDPAIALRLLQLLAFAVSSAERHLQAAGAAPGTGVDALHAAPVLIHLGEVAGHAPRDSHYTYWLLNQGGIPLMFTGSSEEAMLIRVMREMHHLQSESAVMLRPVCSGDISVTHRMAVDAIAFAAHNHDRLTTLLHSMLAPSSKRPGMHFEMFAMMLDTYLVDYPIGMQTYLAPDPGNMPGLLEMSIMVGETAADRERALQRMLFLMPDDRTRIEAAMKQPSLAVRIAEAASLTEQALPAMSDQELADRIAQQPWLHDTLTALAHLVAAMETSASYFQVIRDYFHPAASPLSSWLSNAKTLVQHDDDGRYDTIPQVTQFRLSNPTVRRLIAVANA